MTIFYSATGKFGWDRLKRAKKNVQFAVLNSAFHSIQKDLPLITRIFVYGDEYNFDVGERLGTERHIRVTGGSKAHPKRKCHNIPRLCVWSRGCYILLWIDFSGMVVNIKADKMKMEFVSLESRHSLLSKSGGHSNDIVTRCTQALEIRVTRSIIHTWKVSMTSVNLTLRTDRLEKVHSVK